VYHCWSPERLEKKAVEILAQYNGGNLLSAPQAMDVDDFAEFYCHATIDFARLSQDKLTLGCSCFNDGVLMVWDETRTKEIPLEVKKGCILIDDEASDNDRRERFTVIHECSHLLLHPRFYYQKPGSPVPKIECTIYHMENWTQRPPMTDDEIREWQANRLGAALIMPSQTVKSMMAERLGVIVNGLAPMYVSDVFIQGMADVYQVSKSAMRNRLRDLDLLLQ
jgi:Zn-dependent peptidase ImmA (M78 family)